MKKTIYCANCQADTSHTATVERAEIIFTCDTCARFLKFPGGMNAPELQEAVSAHKAANQGLHLIKTDKDLIETGQMTQLQIDAALAAIEALK